MVGAYPSGTFPARPRTSALGDDVLDHPVFVQRWGNLTLLHAPLNIGASNSQFINKQLSYTDSEVTLTSDLCRYLRWGLDVIERRQEWLALLTRFVFAGASAEWLTHSPGGSNGSNESSRRSVASAEPNGS